MKDGDGSQACGSVCTPPFAPRTSLIPCPRAQVSQQGDLTYEVPADYQATLLSSSLKLRLEPTLESIANTLAYVSRVAFGGALFLSILTTYVAVFALLQVSQRG